LRIPADCVYEGRIAQPGNTVANLPDLGPRDRRDLGLVPHTFRLKDMGPDGKQLITLWLPTPPDFEMCETGKEFKAGETLIHAMDKAPEWKGMDTRARWRSLLRFFDQAAMGRLGGHHGKRYWEQLWFALEGIRPEGDPRPLYPADMVQFGSHRVHPTGLYWNLAKTRRFYSETSRAIILPPVRLGGWDRLRLELPHGVYVDARVCDARFKADKVRHRDQAVIPVNT
jgi:hypothetical protein